MAIVTRTIMQTSDSWSVTITYDDTKTTVDRDSMEDIDGCDLIDLVIKNGRDTPAKIEIFTGRSTKPWQSRTNVLSDEIIIKDQRVKTVGDISHIRMGRS